VGVLDENGHPTKYSNYASGRTDIIWVPEYQTADGKPVPGTSFGAPQISYLLTKMAQARPDLKPDQLVSILYDYRVSPRVNLRPTIEHPYSAATLQAALDVAEEKYGPKKDTSEITAETESELELLPLPEPEPQPEPEFEIIQETEPATEDEWNGPLSGIYQGTSQYHEVWDCFWIYVSDVRETLTVHLRQKGSQVEGIIICSDVTWTSESDDPFDPAEPFFIPLLNYDAFTAEVDANGNLGFTYLQLGGIEYTRMSHSPLERVYSGTISGNSMTLNFFTKDSDLERTGTFTASRISGRFDEAVFEEYYGRWEELAQ